ncbi:MAG TPA: hypothetical protein VK750_03350, partial [Cytophagaceae bacterium]|nr:hypothetical protein [Cytophagaceae bacterium]
MTDIRNKALRVVVKTILWLIGIVLVSGFSIWVILKVPRVQNFLVHKITSFVSNKTHTRVELGRIDLRFPKSIVLQYIFLDDLNKDTLLSVDELEIDINMLALLHHEVDIQYLSLHNAKGQLSRAFNDSTFNFQFLIDSFSNADKIKEIDTTSRSMTNWTISAYRVYLRSCRFEMEDAYGGFFLYASLKEADAKLKDLDLIAQSVSVGEVKLTEVSTRIERSNPTIVDTTVSSGQGWDKVFVDHVQIEKSVFNYNDPLSCMSIAAKINKLDLGKSNMSLIAQTIQSKRIQLSNSSSSIQLEKDTMPSVIAAEHSEVDNKDWNITLDEASFENNAFKFDFTNVPAVAHGVDWNHLSIKKISTTIRGALYNGPVIKATVEQLTAQERSGLGIRSLRTTFTMDGHQAELSNLTLHTNHSSIGQHVHVKYKGLDQLLSTLQVNCSMINNQLAIQDLLLLQPDWRKIDVLNKNTNQKIDFTIKAKGNTKNLTIQQLTVYADSSTVFDLYGKVKDVTNPNRLFMDLQIKNLQSGRRDIHALVPDSLLPGSIQLPDSIAIKGNYKGTLTNFQSHVQVATSFGNASVDALISNLQSKQPGYELSVETNEFQLGSLLKQTSLGKISAEVKVRGRGTGTALENTQAKTEVTIHEIEMNSYAYQNIICKAAIDTGLISLYTAIVDKNLHALLQGKVNVLTNQESYDFRLELKGIDFKGLGLTTDQIQMSAIGDVLFKGNYSQNLTGHVAVRNILLIKETQEYRIDSLVFATFNEEGNNRATLNSSIVTATFNGNIDLLSVVPALEKHVDHYFHYLSHEEEKGIKPEPQKFNFEIQLNDAPILREVIFPKMTSYQDLHVQGGFNSDSSRLWLTAILPELAYDDFSIQRLNFTLDSDSKKMTCFTGWELLKSSDIAVQQTSLSGTMAH